MSAPVLRMLGDLVVDAKPGFACGEEDSDGIFQIRMNNVTRSGRMSLDKKRYVPANHKSAPSALLRSGDVLFNATNSPDLVGKTLLFPGLGEPTVFSNHFLRLRTDQERLTPSYLAHWLQDQFQRGVFKSKCKQWVNQATVGRESLLGISLPVPSLAVQREIVSVLDHVEELRAKRREALSLLGDLAQAIFLSMFGDSRENPNSWPTDSLANLVDVADRINYGVVQPGDEYPEGVPLVRVGDLVDGRVDRSAIKRIDPLIEAKYSRSRLKGNEILVGCVGSIGSIALAGDPDIGSNVARAVARIPISSDPLREYLAEHLRTASVQRYFTGELRTVAQPTLNIKQLSETIVMIPPVDRQVEFALRVSAIRKQQESQAAHLSLLDALFASLQDRAFNGALWSTATAPVD
ncbi:MULTISPECIES: restriction endonuclease subunit S [unclassified Streptomyces]|uniref:restriction endonuclease subunit S n=1 Tax=unclassified Streptomyces TaxID=2593676 RepID=UPI002E190ABE|nr:MULTISPECIES: restriction endonuclease subunit S [unclassified Streptomyces]